MKTYPIVPVPKPRMTQSDRWKKRPVVMRYFAFKDEIKKHGVELPLRGAHVIFVIPMPKSWSKKKKESMVDQYHQQTPDIDNLFKALADAIFESDADICDVRISKIWGNEGKIRINHKKEG